MNSHILATVLEENNYKIFWVFRVYRCPSSKAYELYGNQIGHDTDRSYAVWFDGEDCKYMELKEIYPDRAEINDDYINQYMDLYDGRGFK